jgi:hypothetical protein
MGDGGSRPGNWGTALATHDGVTAYSNGGDVNYAERGTYGLMYQCVEYANRYAAQVHGTSNMSGTGHAKNYAGNRSGYGFTWVPNTPGPVLPESGDLLVFTGGSFGHIAVATSGGPSGVGMIQQNTASATATLGVSGSEGSYVVNNWGGLTLAGWQHRGEVDWSGGGASHDGGQDAARGTDTAQTGGGATGTSSASTLGDGNRYGELATLNGLSNPSALRVGQIIRLPGGGAAAAPAPAPAPAPQQPSDKTYRVQPGDSLWAIAARQLGSGARYGEIARLNGIANPSPISVGAVLKLP